jgi:signal transduction histidine kinase
VNHFASDEIDLRALVEKVQRIDRGSVYFRESHSFHFSIEAEVPRIIVGDSDKLQQILHNLIGDALKYSPDGGEIKLHARLSAPKLILFTITDQGIGMSPEFLPRFGEKFARASTEEVRMINGTGIGIFLCKTFIKTFAGRLWASSEGLGKGSTVYFTLSTEAVMAHDPEFTSAVAELRRWQIKLSALLAEVETLPREHYRFDATARADFSQLVHTELGQMQAFLTQLEKDHATDHD